MVIVVLASIVAGGIAALSPDVQPPWAPRGRAHFCEVRCGPGYCAVDLTPQNKNDCHFACVEC